MDELQACVLPAAAVDVDGEAEAAVSPSALACVRVMANVLESDLLCHSDGSSLFSANARTTFLCTSLILLVKFVSA